MSDVSEISGFTPGPWYLSRTGHGSIVRANAATLVGLQAGLTHLDVVARTDWGRGEEDEANARLIAAAPDMHAEIARLRTHTANMEEWKAEIGRYAKENDRLRREKKALVEALKPFAAIQTSPASLSEPLTVWGYIENSQKFHEACEAARAALRSATETKDGQP